VKRLPLPEPEVKERQRKQETNDGIDAQSTPETESGSDNRSDAESQDASLPSHIPGEVKGQTPQNNVYEGDTPTPQPEGLYSRRCQVHHTMNNQNRCKDQRVLKLATHQSPDGEQKHDDPQQPK
jgi:hypothetical protein